MKTTLWTRAGSEGQIHMPSDENALQGYCASCKRVFEVRWSETVCPVCEFKLEGKGNEKDSDTGPDV